MQHESFEKRSYIEDLSISNARQLFKFRSKMYDVKFNYKNQTNYKEDIWKCSSCLKCIESQNHVLFCEAYAPLRDGKSLESDKDLSEYLKKVILIWESLKITK